jgi:hypothetical protein
MYFSCLNASSSVRFFFNGRILDLSFGGVAKVRIWMPGKESDSDIVWTMKNALNEFDN